MTTAATTAVTSAVATGAVEVSRPIATPASATWPSPSPISESRRCTRKIPTSGAAAPMRMAATKALRMNE